MITKLTRIGDAVALVIDAAVLDAANMVPDASVEVSTDGHEIIIAPFMNYAHAERLRRAGDWAHAKYANAFKRLAK
jgi:antitoxin component of MazEF toxin-antitoxin module